MGDYFLAGCLMSNSAFRQGREPRNYQALAASLPKEISPEEYRAKLLAWLSQAQQDIDDLTARNEAYEDFMDTLFPSIFAMLVTPLRSNFRAASELSAEFNPNALARLPLRISRKTEIVRAWMEILTTHHLPIPGIFTRICDEDAEALSQIAFPPSTSDGDEEDGDGDSVMNDGGLE